MESRASGLSTAPRSHCDSNKSYSRGNSAHYACSHTFPFFFGGIAEGCGSKPKPCREVCLVLHTQIDTHSIELQCKVEKSEAPDTFHRLFISPNAHTYNIYCNVCVRALGAGQPAGRPLICSRMFSHWVCLLRGREAK